MSALKITEMELFARARMAAAADHFRTLPGVTPLPVQLVRVERVELFDKTYNATPDDIGEIEVTYAREGCRAIYGFTANGDMTLYMD